LEHDFGHVSLELHRGGQSSCLLREWFLQEMDLHGNLQGVQAVGLSEFKNFFPDLLLHSFCIIVSSNYLWVRVDERDYVAFSRVAMDPNLVDQQRDGVDVFELFWGDILTLTQFKDVLCSVNDLD
jgi:hypothetical protein